MSPSRRRTVLFGLLLLAPTLAVGTSALWLLRREQVRVAEQAVAVEEQQHAAVVQRTSLVAENMAVLLEDLRTSLGAALAEMPRGAERQTLDTLRRTHPFVRDVFIRGADGRVIWGADSAETMTWLQRDQVSVDETVVRRQLEEAEARKDAQAEAEGRQLERSAQKQMIVNSANYSLNRAQFRDAVSAKAEVAAPAAASAEMDLDRSAVPRQVQWGASAEGLFAWVETNRGERVGLAVNLAALAEQLSGVLPQEVPAGETYALVTAAANGRTSRAKEAEVPVSELWLPHWRVTGSRLAAASGANNGMGALWAGAGLVALLSGAVVIGGVLLVRDARRHEIEALQKTSFVANISHEFKTPLTSIRLYAELLEQGRVAGAEKQRDYLSVIGRETARLTRLVNNALDFGRLEQGKKTFDLQPVDLAAEVDGLLTTHAPRIEAAGLRLERVLPVGSGVTASVDRDALHQILLNLIDNACKYAAVGGELQVSVEELGLAGEAVVCVSDRGPGIPVAQRERIFEKFARLDDSLTAEQGGTGLGLCLARQLARGMGGELHCGAREGGGAVFVLSLP